MKGQRRAGSSQQINHSLPLKEKERLLLSSHMLLLPSCPRHLTVFYIDTVTSMDPTHRL